jgi:hypothetical protein
MTNSLSLSWLRGRFRECFITQREFLIARLVSDFIEIATLIIRILGAERFFLD